MHSGLRGVGEAVKAINENLLTCGLVRAYAYARSARGCARSCVNRGREMKKWGSSEEGGGNEGRKGNQWKMKVRKMGEKGKPESEKYSRCAKREVWR